MGTSDSGGQGSEPFHRSPTFPHGPSPRSPLSFREWVGVAALVCHMAPLTPSHHLKFIISQQPNWFPKLAFFIMRVNGIST